MKKFLTLFLVIIMLVTLSTVFVVFANAEEEIENNQVVYAASIGEENYSTLQEAIAASVTGDKIVLLANVVLEETVVISEKQQKIYLFYYDYEDGYMHVDIEEL